MTVCFGQGTYGGISYFNFTYSSVADWTGFGGGANFTTTVDGEELIFGNSNALGSTRSKGGYTGAVRCQSIELELYTSLGHFSFYAQNGSSGTTRNLYIKVWDDNVSNWITVESYAVGGNVNQRFTPLSVLSKKGVKVKIDSDGSYFWFHQLEAWSSTLATTDVAEAPTILSVNPVGESVIPSSGIIRLQFDEIIKAGMGSVSFSGATVTSAFLGNTLEITYSGLTNPSNTLTVPATYILNNDNVSIEQDTSIIYANDLTDPIYQTASPVDGSNIVVNDILEKIVLTFNEDIELGAGTISFGPATVTTTVSGQSLIIGYSGLDYSTPYSLTIPADMIKDISGNTYKNDIVLNYITYPKDNTPPVLSSQSVVNGAVNVPIGGSIYFVFDEIVQQSSDVTINGTPFSISVNGFMVGVNYTNFNYNTTYTVNIPSGSIMDTTGNFYAGTTFSFTTKPFTKKVFDIIVDKNGSGDYTTIQDAVNEVPDNLATRTFIFIKNGLYIEKVLIPATKQNLSLIGQDPAKTIIAYNDYAGGAGGTDQSYTVNVKASGFYAENITFQNTWTVTGGTSNQAVALMTEGDRQVFKNCSIISFQDTHYPKQANTRSYYLNCLIEGATDFMFGGGTAFFEACSINCVNGGQYITAPSGTTREFGLVYNNCSVTANADVASQKYYLGRPWKDNAKTVWLNTRMGDHLKDIGWSVWTTTGADADNHLTGFFGEYNSKNLEGAPINPIRASWGVKLTSDQAARYNIDNVFNYGLGSNTWNPLPFSVAPETPANFSESGHMLTWDSTGYAVSYIIFRNDTVIGTTTATTYTDVAAPVGSNNYKVKAVNEYGAQSIESTGTISSIDLDYFTKSGVQLYPNPFNEVITIKNSDKLKAIEFLNTEGQLIKRSSAQFKIRTSDLKAGYYMVRVITTNGESYYIKMVKP